MTLVLVHHLWNAPHEYNPKYDIHYTVGTQLHTELKAGLKLESMYVAPRVLSY